MGKQIVLCDLVETVDSSSNQKSRMTTWLDKHPKLIEGAKITLADYQPQRVWTVEKIYDSPAPHYVSEFDFHRSWDNNNWDNNNYDKHKGLGV